MVWVVIAEESVQTIIEGLCNKCKLQLGLLIGQNSQQKTFVVTAVATAVQENGNEGDLEIDEAWVVEHARQVARMLPGGLDIIGVFLISSSESMTQYQSQLRSVMHKICRICQMYDQLASVVPASTQSLERVSLEISTITRKYTCRVLDISDHKASSRSADMKFQSFVSKWHTMSCQVAFDWTSYLPTVDKSLIASRHLHNYIRNHLETFGRAVFLCDGELRDEADQLEKSQVGKSQKVRAIGKKTHHVEFFTDNTDVTMPSISTENSEMCLRFQGNIQGLAYVHSKATVGNALLRSDIVRSVLARCDVMSDDLINQFVGDESLASQKKQSEMGSRVVPRRVLFPVCHEITFCDYAFQDESPQDVCERLKDILGLEITADNLQFCEDIPDIETKSAVHSVVESVGVTSKLPSTQWNSSNRFWFLVVSFAMACVAVVIYLQST
ncbi:protein odr-4 homolog isoform X2 [Corticium candelabrum]|uniref:protein odr-4 homolog isoform X2 n=1 Tax=Corticium candelabrum TaxID=121492 RepID=UPI002E272DDE|nr:protein odr-4 homolog isoform X2 [Corticium candelabrum]